VTGAKDWLVEFSTTKRLALTNEETPSSAMLLA